MTPKKCSTPMCDEPATKEWGVDKKPVCPSCYAECEIHLQSVRELAAIWEGKKE